MRGPVGGSLYDEIFTVKKITFGTLLAFKRQACHRNKMNPGGQVDNVCAIYDSDLINLCLKMKEILALS